MSLPFTVIPSRHCGRCSRSLLGLVAEAGPEAIIPLSVGMRSRALALYEETGRRLGVRPYAKDWTSGKWDEMKTVWETAKEAISSTLFSKDWWGRQWESVKSWASNALSGIVARWESIKESFQAGREAGQRVAATKHAIGGILTRPHLGLVAEAGPEAIIPLPARMRARALALYEETGRRLGVRPYAEGGLAGTMTEGRREKIPVSSVPSLALPGPATINLNFDLTGLVRQVVIESREDIDGAVDRIADAIANNLRAVFQNMTK